MKERKRKETKGIERRGNERRGKEEGSKGKQLRLLVAAAAKQSEG